MPYIHSFSTAFAAPDPRQADVKKPRPPQVAPQPAPVHRDGLVVAILPDATPFDVAPARAELLRAMVKHKAHSACLLVPTARLGNLSSDLRLAMARQSIGIEHTAAPTLADAHRLLAEYAHRNQLLEDGAESTPPGERHRIA
jgi:hypothetical protein